MFSLCPGYLPTNKTTCYNENCFGITGLSGNIDEQLVEYESYGCGDWELWNQIVLSLWVELHIEKYKKSTGNSSSNVLLQAAGFTFRGSSQAKL